MAGLRIAMFPDAIEGKWSLWDAKTHAVIHWRGRKLEGLTFSEAWEFSEELARIGSEDPRTPPDPRQGELWSDR
jgi:hypothetical protein